MPTIQEMVKFESEVSPGVIRLVKCGEFYRAYNHSAWLFQCCITEHKVMRKYIKALAKNVYYIGFPEKSLFGNIGDRKSEKTEYGFDIILAEDELPDENAYEFWCQTIDTEQSSKADFHSMILTGTEAEREVIKRIKDFPFETKTMLDCAVFIAELRKILSPT